MTETINTRSQEKYWYKLEQIKFDLFYYNAHFIRCVKISRIIRIGVSFLTALTSGIWMSFYNEKVVNIICLIIIILLQAFNSAVELLPYDKRKLEIREMSNEITDLYNQMEHDWVNVSNGNWTEKTIEDKCFQYINRQEEICKHYFKNDILPEKKACKNKAKKETDIYFINFK